MSIGWIEHYKKRNRKEKKRQQRLIRKMQKANVLHHREEIAAQHSWNKRFHTVSKLRFENA